MEDIKAKLDQAVKRRNALAEKRSKLEGRRGEAEAQLKKLRAQCSERGIDPDQVEEVVAKYQAKLSKAVESILKKMDQAEAEIAPYEDRLN